MIARASAIAIPIALAAVALTATLALPGCTTTSTTVATDPTLIRPTNDTSPTTRARIHTELGAGYYARAQYAVALEELNGAVRDDPSYAPAYGVLALVYSQLKDEAQAERNFQRSISLAPQDPDVRNNYGWYLCEHGHESQAMQEFELAIRNPFYRTPDMALVNAGRCAIRIGDRRGAEAYFDRVLAISPTNGPANFYLAEMAYKSGDLTLARSRMRLAMQSSSTPEALMLGACIERRLGNKSDESSYVMQLRQRFPNAREAKLVDSGGCL